MTTPPISLSSERSLSSLKSIVSMALSPFIDRHVLYIKKMTSLHPVPARVCSIRLAGRRDALPDQNNDDLSRSVHSFEEMPLDIAGHAGACNKDKLTGEFFLIENAFDNRLINWKDALHGYDGDVQNRRQGYQPSLILVVYQPQSTRFGDGKIYTGNSRFHPVEDGVSEHIPPVEIFGAQASHACFISPCRKIERSCYIVGRNHDAFQTFLLRDLRKLFQCLIVVFHSVHNTGFSGQHF